MASKSAAGLEAGVFTAVENARDIASQLHIMPRAPAYGLAAR